MLNQIKRKSMKSLSFLRGTVCTVIAVLGLAAFTSCNPTQKLPTPLTAPQPTLAAATVNSLTFSWKAVTDAVEYGYELTDAAGAQVKAGSTQALNVTFTKLTENTTYTFKLTAYCAESDSDHEMSESATVTGTTAAIQPLKAPAPTAKYEAGIVTITWEAVENANSYSYSYGVEGAEAVTGSTEETSLCIENLANGDYNFSITAVSADEAYSDSEAGSCKFTVSTVEKWRVTGIFFDGAGKYWNAVLVAMSDGSYSLKNWYNVEGYDLNFTVDAENNDQLKITNATSVSDNAYYYVAAGLSKDVCIYPIDQYSNFSGDQQSGEIYFYNYTSNASSTFQWPAPEGSAVTADAIAGTYTQSSKYYYYYTSWEAYTSDNDVTITKVDDTHITIEGLIWENYGKLTATIDPATGIIRIDPQLYDYWTFAGCTELSPVVGAYKDGVITLNGWNLWYMYEGNTYYSQNTYDTFTTLTKK